MATATANSSLELELAREIMRYEHDPLGFVEAVFPWGEGELEGVSGPREWQRETLAEIGDRLREGGTMRPILRAIGSGHGIGKSALLAWIVNWALSTCPHSKVVLTANTEPQLRTKTWPEISKWTRLAVNAHWWEVQGTSILARQKRDQRTWRCDAVTWSETNTQAFAGLHNLGRRLVLLFDEASGIADGVWDVASGAYTDEDTEILHIACGQLAEPRGRFFEAFGSRKHIWHPRSIDSRDVEGTNKAWLDEVVREYGEDSDYVRVRVRGLPPRAGTMQFIGPELIAEAASREAISHLAEPLVLGVDVARYGDDQSVIVTRKGRDARTIPTLKFRGMDTMQLAGRVAEQYERLRPEAVFVDGGGVGGGVVDRLRQLGVPVVEVQFGGRADRAQSADERHIYANKRSEMWGNMRQWLAGGAIADDAELRADLAGPSYAFTIKDGRDAIALERKEDMKKRGLSSPDIADALALTFAYPVFSTDGIGGGMHAQPSIQTEYDPWH